jgi:hypothetical protein
VLCRVNAFFAVSPERRHPIDYPVTHGEGGYLGADLFDDTNSLKPEHTGKRRYLPRVIDASAMIGIREIHPDTGVPQ